MTGGKTRFGSYLRAVRESRRLTLEDVERETLAEPEPITRSLLSRMENGRSSISALKLLSLSRLYGVGFGLLAERLELEQELAEIPTEDVENLSPRQLMVLAREAGSRGRIHRALLLYESAEVGCISRPEERGVRIRARLGIGRALLAAGRFRNGCRVLEELSADDLSHEDRIWAYFLLCRGYRHMGRLLLARAVFRALEEAGEPVPAEIAPQIPALRAELLAEDGRLDESHGSWLEALDRARSASDAQSEVYCTLSLAEIERRRAKLDVAMEWAEKGRGMAQTLGFPFLLVKLWTETGRIERARSHFDSARKAWSTARRLARSLDLHPELFDIYHELWQLAREQGNESEQRSYVRRLKHLSRFMEALPRDAKELGTQLPSVTESEDFDGAKEDIR